MIEATAFGAWSRGCCRRRWNDLVKVAKLVMDV